MKIIKLAAMSLTVGAAMLTMNAAYAQDTIKVGVIAALTGPFANIGKPFEDGIKTYMQQYGSTVAGKKIEIIYRDDGGTNADMSKRAAQEPVSYTHLTLPTKRIV